ncbi:hypothetical protein GLYMA_10G175150v4 [Glycine max]|nr:hypothetical protein GLYMA_10G175150v4 [Glycine max]KAH1138779.1 hypothetical protein GYH30_028309 [Glycine max]
MINQHTILVGLRNRKLAVSAVYFRFLIRYNEMVHEIQQMIILLWLFGELLRRLG